MTSGEIQRQIFRLLRHGPLDYVQVAGAICQAPFRVRAELNALKRAHMVREHRIADKVAWELTVAGMAAAWQGD
jgi:hypothetical protein